MILTRLSNCIYWSLSFLFSQEVRNFSRGFYHVTFSISSKLLCSKLRLYTIFNLCMMVYLFLNCNKTVDMLNFYISSKALTMQSIH